MQRRLHLLHLSATPMRTDFSVALAFLPDDGSEPDELEINEIPWPVGCPVPRADDSFVWDNEEYAVVDVQFTPCNNHDGVLMVHVLLLLGAEGIAGRESPLPLGTELTLP